MEARQKRFEDLNITRDEINNIGKALQKEEFRKLFVEYCEEVTNPESKKQYQNEISELEKQRGVNVTFINPEPGFVVKTSIDGERKAFINISKNEKVLPPSSTPVSEEGKEGSTWSLPFSLAPAREDFDKSRNRCTVFDVVFHPETLNMAQKRPEFRKMIINTALDAVEDNCKVKLDRANLKYPKMTYKGLPQAAVIRKKILNHQTPEEDHEFLNQIPFPEENNLWSSPKNQGKVVEEKKQSVDYTTPKYTIKYRHGIDMSDFTDDASARLHATVPKELVIVIDLPLLKSAKALSLDVTPKSLSLKCENPKYKLELLLPYGVDEDSGNASFDTSTRKLTLELPVKRSIPSIIDVGREDSGVESDPGGRVDDDSDEKSPSESSDVGSEGSDLRSVQEVPYGSVNDSYASADVYLHCDSFTKQDTVYQLPHFSWNTVKNMVAVVLHVKNVESSSIVQSILSEGHGFQVSFSSLGGGLFPQSYGFYMVLADNVTIEEGTLTVEAWDNNVVAQFCVTPMSPPITEMLVGTGPHDVQLRDVASIAVIEKMADLMEKTANALAQSPLIEMQIAKEDQLVLKIESYNASKVGAQESSSSTSLNEATVTSPSAHSALPQDKLHGSMERGRRNTVRQLSECSSDDLNGKKIRGILKKRPLRSLSESNADDYAQMYHSTSLSDEGESGSNSVMGSALCIGEEGCETGCETENDSGDRQSKKTVRFNDVVAQQTFRPNSSILGQRKKNQRKQRNKKRAHERRASESENSEPESELEKARRRACHSEGEASDFEDKCGKKNKFLKELKREPENLQAKKILRRANSSDTDEDLAKDETSAEMTKKVSPTGDRAAGDSAAFPVDSVSKVESSDQVLQSTTPGESSEDERDEKTDDKKKKKKKRKGKKVSVQGDGGKSVSKEKDPEFKSDLVLELEM